MAMMILGFVASVSATVGPISAVGGTVYQADKVTTVSGAAVDVTCNGVTESTSTNLVGDYYVTFAPGVCYYNDPVSVNAVKDGAKGSNDGVMCSAGKCIIPITVIDVTIPEFGVMAGAVALIGALGIFVYRRKN